MGLLNLSDIVGEISFSRYVNLFVVITVSPRALAQPYSRVEKPSRGTFE